MAQQIDKDELTDFSEILISNTIQIDTMYQLLIEKGFFTEAEFLAKMKKVQLDYQGRQSLKTGT